jgi:glutamate racemase
VERKGPIGFFDSGLGGISVLRETVGRLPGEDFLYFGDSLHAPYGVRPAEEVAALTEAAAEFLLSRGCKAIVIACNTATSAAAELLRQKYPDMPIIGTEPALKPAVQKYPGGRILVLATAMTLKEEKFLRLWDQYRQDAEIIPVPCSGLMEFVEQGILRGPELEAFLMERLEPYMKVTVDAVVLGCTHYPFLKGTIRKLIGRKPEIMDGSDGVARQLHRRLLQLDLLNPRTEGGTVTFLNSLEGPEMIQLSEKLLQYQDITD